MTISHTRIAVLLGLIATCVLPARSAQTVRWFVDADSPGGDGTGWASAFDNLQSALDAAGADDVIWVAAGTYTPSARTAPADPRSAVFQVFEGLRLIGGFSGNEDPASFDLADRDLIANETVLSGDLLQDDRVSGAADNAYHVINATTADLSTIVDGFTIRGGRADDPLIFVPRSLGGGLFLNGGGLTLRRCRFVDNLASGSGGAIFASKSLLTLRDCALEMNTAGLKGGGCYVQASDATVVNTVFAMNAANQGGAFFNEEGQSALHNALFWMNAAADSGGGIGNENGFVQIVSATLADNSAASGQNGAGVFSNRTIGTTMIGIRNSILFNHTGIVDGRTQLHTAGGGAIEVTYSCVQDGVPDGVFMPGGPGVITGPGNTDLDPMFAGGPVGDFILLTGSPCLDAGDNDALPADIFDLDHDGDFAEPLSRDLAGNNRRADVGTVEPDPGNPGIVGPPVVDMGAFEHAAPSCVISSVQFVECPGPTVDIQLDGSASSHPQGDPLDYAWEVDCPQGAFGGTEYDPVATLTVDTSAGTTLTCTVTLTLTNDAVPPFSCQRVLLIDDTTPPVAMPVTDMTDEDTPLLIDVLAAAGDACAPDLLVVDTASPALHGDLTIATNGIFYTPDEHYGGDDAFSCIISDPAGNTATVDVQLLVLPVADVPVLQISAAQIATDEDVAVGLGASSMLTDQDGSESLTVLVGGMPPGSLLSSGVDQGDGTWTLTGPQLDGAAFTPPPNSHADFDILMTAIALENGNGDMATTSGTVSIAVAAVNDAPILTVPALQSGVEDLPLAVAGVSVDDIDANETPAAQVEVTLSADSGSLSLSYIGGLAFSVGSGTGDAIMVFSAPLSDAATALATLSYTGAPDFNGADSITVSVDDLGHTGSGGPQSRTRSIPVLLDAVNDPPRITAPPALFADEDVELAITGLMIDDVDADEGGGQLELSLSVENGALTLAATDGLTFIGGSDGVADADMTVIGSLAAIEAAVDGMIYRGRLDYHGADTLHLNVDDLGNTGSGGSKLAAHATSITVDPVNDPPTAVDDHYLETGEGELLIFNANGLTLNDYDVDGDDITLLFIGQPEHGAIMIIRYDFLAFTYLPDPGYSGLDTFEYAIADDFGLVDRADVSVNVLQAAVEPHLAVLDAVGDENSAIPLSISASLATSDGTETLTVVIDGVPEGAVLSAGIDAGNGTWNLQPADCQGLSITPPLYDSADFTLTVTAVATVVIGGDSASTSAVLRVTVNDLNNAPIAVCRDVYVAIEADCQAAASLAEIDDGSFDPDGDDISLAVVPAGPYRSGVNDVALIATDPSGRFDVCFSIIEVENPCVLSADSDTFIEDGNPDANEGANDILGVGRAPIARTLVGFDLVDIPLEGLTAATLILAIDEVGGDWGQGRGVIARRLTVPWEEGNGFHAGGAVPGTGGGATFNCPIDADISDVDTDCPWTWDGAANGVATPTALPAKLSNASVGVTDWDVTQDVLDGAAWGWLISKQDEGQQGDVRYVSREAATAAGAPQTAPLLELHYQSETAGPIVLPYAVCLQGPGGSVHPACRSQDADMDGDVDLMDFALNTRTTP